MARRPRHSTARLDFLRRRRRRETLATCIGQPELLFAGSTDRQKEREWLVAQAEPAAFRRRPRKQPATMYLRAGLMKLSRWALRDFSRQAEWIAAVAISDFFPLSALEIRRTKSSNYLNRHSLERFANFCVVIISLSETDRRYDFFRSPFNDCCNSARVALSVKAYRYEYFFLPPLSESLQHLEPSSFSCSPQAVKMMMMRTFREEWTFKHQPVSRHEQLLASRSFLR